ncbi:MAG: motility associated factor glycosyltransferase family protein [Deltaproteobacteria bacterium]|nr:motility associated factor glycosyltransferase family protein [Deltaproteobacteria bacterium]
MMHAEKHTGKTSILKNNLDALENWYPELYKRVVELPEEIPDYIVRTGEKSSFLNVLFRGPDKNTFYYDNDDPIGYSPRYIKSLDLNYAPFLVFLGFGLGYHIVTTLNGFSKSHQIRHIVIVEKDIELFKAALRIFDFSQVIMHPDIELIIGYQHQDLFVAFRSYFANNPQVLEYSRNLKFIIMPALHRSENEYYGNAYQIFKNAMIHVFDYIGNDPYDSLIGLYQTISNLHPMIQDPGIITFKNCFQGKPAIVIGAGPSLNKNIHFLKKASHKAILISVDAALRPLLDVGIRPHVVTNIEMTKGQDLFFSNLEGVEDTFFVFSPVVPPETYDAFKGPKILAHRYEEIMQWLDIPKGALEGGPLVGNFAFNIAQYLGCCPIILAGQDLSFKLTGATHVKGNVFGHIDEYKNDTLEVEGNYNETLLTTRSFDEGRKRLELQVQEFDGLVINATEGGAKIRGTLFLGLRNAIDNYCKTDFNPLCDLKRIWAAEKAEQKDTKSELKRIDAIIEESLSELDSATVDCRHSIEMIESVLNQNQLLIDDKPNPKVVQVIRSVSRELNKTRKNIISLPSFVTFEMVIQSYHFDLEIRRNFTREQYSHPDFAELKSFLLMKEWFATVGQLILSTYYAIRREKAILQGKALPFK